MRLRYSTSRYSHGYQEFRVPHPRLIRRAYRNVRRAGVRSHDARYLVLSTLLAADTVEHGDVTVDQSHPHAAEWIDAAGI